MKEIKTKKLKKIRRRSGKQARILATKISSRPKRQIRKVRKARKAGVSAWTKCAQRMKKAERRFEKKARVLALKIYKQPRKLRKNLKKALTFGCLKRLATAVLVFGLVFQMSLGAIMPTVATFNDLEEITNNTYAAGTLDADFGSAADFAPAITPTANSSRAINFSNMGSLDINYKLETNNLSGDLCDHLTLKNGSGATFALTDFLENTTTLVFGGSHVLNLETALAGSYASENKTCAFDLVAIIWQTNLADESQGFTARKIIANTINGITTTALAGVVLNEFLPNPSGTDDALMPGGEWVELYNTNDMPIDVAGWYLYDNNDGHDLPITITNTNTHSTNIPSHGWLVVYRNGDSNFELNNTVDEVRLYNGQISSGTLIDSYGYDGSEHTHLTPTPGTGNVDDHAGTAHTIQDDKSFARIPDGAGEWVDPIPTPGGANVLEDTQIGADLLQLFTDTQIETDKTTTTEDFLLSGGSGATTEEIIIPPATEESTTTEELVSNEEERENSGQPADNSQQLANDESQIAEAPIGDVIQNPEPEEFLSAEEIPLETLAEIPAGEIPPAIPEEIIETPPPAEEVTKQNSPAAEPEEIAAPPAPISEPAPMAE